MAKTVSTKKREPSIHSRAAKRASPPPKDLVKKTTAEKDYQPWIHGAQDAGISKKIKSKQLSHGQKQRKLKGIEQAGRNQDKLEKKVADSKNRSKRTQARAIEWEELNQKVKARKPSEGKSVASHIARMGELEREAEEDGSKLAEGVEMSGIEQPPPVRVAETAAKARESAENTIVPDAGDTVPATKGATNEEDPFEVL